MTPQTKPDESGWTDVVRALLYELGLKHFMERRKAAAAARRDLHEGRP